MPEGATLAQPEEVTEILRCFRDSLCEPVFASALALLAAGNQRERETAERTAPVAIPAKR